MNDNREGHRSKFSKDRSHQKNASTFDQKRGTKVDRSSGFTEQIHVMVHQKIPSFLQGAEGHKKISLGPEQVKAFEDLKKCLENLAVMTSPSPGAELLLYIATSSSAISASLVEERMVEGTSKQLPIYFVSEALSGSKLLYSEMEKMAYAVVMAARKLRHYFQSFKIKVPTSFPLQDMFEN
jgi:hypothetical protein